jgi:hypothetical protein
VNDLAMIKFSFKSTPNIKERNHSDLANYLVVQGHEQTPVLDGMWGPKQMPAVDGNSEPNVLVVARRVVRPWRWSGTDRAGR